MTLGVRICNKLIEYSFYALFFLIPLVFTDRTSELFEFNKMWLTFLIAVIIACCWGIKMVIKRSVIFQRTVIDIPIILFLLSQIIATVFSLDQRVSIWGYYSRFNGGLLSIITYIFLYYALVSNANDIKEQEAQKKPSSIIVRVSLFIAGSALFPFMIALGKPSQPSLESADPLLILLFMFFSFLFFTWSFAPGFIKKILFMVLISGFISAIWGILSHAGLDPTCYLFRGELNVSCWTDAFQPTIRAFSTLGQPAWLAAYMAILLPIAIAFFLKAQAAKEKNYLFAVGYFLFSICFYATLIFTDTRAGFIAFWIANAIFWSILAIKKYFSPRFLVVNFVLLHLSLLLLNFLFGLPINQLSKFTLKHSPGQQKPTATDSVPQATNVTDSGDIRLIVWKGGIEAWKKNPIFGTGVETFAFAYSQYRPKEHNLTSEWDFTYNKAHNEYINYLTTTGLFGLLSYLAMIFVFLIFTVRKLFTSKTTWQQMLVCALLASYISILVSNFFGFSVVIINIFFFLIPALVLLLLQPNSEKTNGKMSRESGSRFAGENRARTISNQHKLSNKEWAGTTVIIFITIYLLIMLARFWYADIAYTKGYNANRQENGQEAFGPLTKSIALRGDEPVFQEELAFSNALIAVALMDEKKATEAAEHTYQALLLSQKVVTNHPNNVSFWKNRVRMIYELARLDPQLLQFAIESLEKSVKLAPTDAKLLYNLGYVYRLTGLPQKAVKILEKTIQLKPEYRDAYFTLGLAYHDLAVDKNEFIINPQNQKKAKAALEHILNSISADDEETIKTLKSWNAL